MWQLSQNITSQKKYIYIKKQKNQHKIPLFPNMAATEGFQLSQVLESNDLQKEHSYFFSLKNYDLQ